MYQGKSKIQIFNFGLSHRPCRGSEVTVGSEDPLQIFERVYLFKRGQVEHILTMANLQLKPSPFTLRILIAAHYCDSFSVTFPIALNMLSWMCRDVKGHRQNTRKNSVKFGKNRLKIKEKAEFLPKENFSKTRKSAEKRNSHTPGCGAIFEVTAHNYKNDLYQFVFFFFFLFYFLQNCYH